MLNGAHREVKPRAAGVAIYWRYGRGTGSVPLATFRGATLADALAAERDGAAELAEAWIAAHRPRPLTGNLAGMAHAFLESPGYRRMAASTQAEWRRMVDIIRADIGHMTRRQLEADTATGALMDWRDRYEPTPRKADYLVTVLRAILKHARVRGWLRADPTKDLESIYQTDRSRIVWHGHEIEEVCAGLGPDLARAIRFAWLTGLRRGDAVAARWDAIDGDVMTVWTSKSRGRTAQVVEIGPDLAALLAETPRRALTILTNAKGAPYTPNALTHALHARLRVIRAKAPDFAAGKRLHDMRGSRATEEVAALLADPEVRARMGWTAGKTTAPSRYVSPVTALAAARARRQKAGT